MHTVFSVSIVIIPVALPVQIQANTSGAEFLSTISKFRKRKKILSLLCFSHGSRAVTAKKCTKKRDACVKSSQALSRYCFFGILVVVAVVASYTP